jgi:hypothetical protein
MPSDKPPLDLLAAFRALSHATDIAVLMIEDGFDALLVRVLSAFEKSQSSWSRPKKPMPDNGRPTPAAWAWLVSGWHFDYEGIALGANISRESARDRIAALVQNRLIFPDGTMSVDARKALVAAVKARLKAEAGGRKKSKDKEEQAN